MLFRKGPQIGGICLVNPLSNNPTKWSSTLKEFVGNLQEMEFSLGFYTDLVGSVFFSQVQNFVIFIKKIVIGSSKTELACEVGGR